MTNSQRLAAVRRRLEQWLDQHGRYQEPSEDSPSPAASRIRQESILIRDGYYCGRQFDAGDHRAVWFIEEDQLKIYTADGKWVCSLQGDELLSTTSSEITSTAITSNETAGEETAGDFGGGAERRDVLPMVHPHLPAATADAVPRREGRPAETRRAA